MRFPRPGERTHAVLSAFKGHDPMTIEEGVAVHGWFSSRKWEASKLYREAVENGWLSVKDGKYQLTLAAIAALTGTAPPAKKDVLAPPYHPPFRPLSAKYIPNIRGSRADAMPSPERNHYSAGSPITRFRGAELVVPEVKVKEEQQ